MRALLRKIRGVLALGLTWGPVWAAVFVALALIVELVHPGNIDPGEGPLRIAWIGAVYGFISGSVFGLLFSLVESRKTIRDLSVPRAALLGIVATAVFPLVTSVDNGILLIVCPVGGALAAASIALAKKVELRPSAEQPQLPT